MLELMEKIQQIVEDAPEGCIMWSELIAALEPQEQQRALQTMKPAQKAGMYRRHLTIENGRSVLRVCTPDAYESLTASGEVE